MELKIPRESRQMSPQSLCVRVLWVDLLPWSPLQIGMCYFRALSG